MTDRDGCRPNCTVARPCEGCGLIVNAVVPREIHQAQATRQQAWYGPPSASTARSRTARAMRPVGKRYSENGVALRPVERRRQSLPW
jgi:hypothetical protein